MFDMFDAIFSPLFDIGKGFLKMLEVVLKILEIFGKIMEAVPSIFEPSKLIDDILYGISFGITQVFSSGMSSLDTEKNPEDKENTGPFDVKDKSKKNTICVPPTIVNTLFLLLCPPLAIFIKHGMGCFISAIICGVLCVKFYYFPGLLFAALNVLCV